MSLAASLSTFSDRRSEWSWPWEWEFLLAYRLTGHLWEAQRSGNPLSQESLLLSETGVRESTLQRLLGHFLEAGLVTRDQQGNWLLTRDLSEVSLLDLYHAGHYHLPMGQVPEILSSSKWDDAFLNAITPQELRMELALKSMYR